MGDPGVGAELDGGEEEEEDVDGEEEEEDDDGEFVSVSVSKGGTVLTSAFVAMTTESKLRSAIISGDR